MREVKLPSGATLKVNAAPFADSKELYQAVAEELKGLKLDPQAEIDANFWKDVFCVGLASKRIEKALRACLIRCQYNDLKVEDSIFEPPEAREDYITVCYEVAKENIQPFMKSLYAQYAAILQNVTQSLLASRPQTTP